MNFFSHNRAALLLLLAGGGGDGGAGEAGDGDGGSGAAGCSKGCAASPVGGVVLLLLKENKNLYQTTVYSEITYDHESVLRIRDVYPGSRILIFTHPVSRISDPGSKDR